MGLVFIFLLVLASPLPATPESRPVADAVERLRATRQQLQTLADLDRRGVLGSETARAESEHFLDQIADIIGSPPTEARLSAALEEADRPGPSSFFERVRGFFTFVNTVWCFASFLIVMSAGNLLYLYLFPVLKLIPAWVYEGLVYLACAALIVGGRSFRPGIGEFVALPGFLGLIPAVILTRILHFRDRPGPSQTQLSLLIFLLWFPITIWYQSELLGFLTVGALKSTLGFAMAFGPLCMLIGFQSRDAIPRTMVTSFLLLIFYLTVTIGNFQIPHFAVFAPGIFYLSTMVYFCGLLIVSSRWYPRENPKLYLPMQILAVVSGIATLFLGSVWQIPYLNRVGGSLFAMYLLQKYLEIPWRLIGWAWGSMALGLLLYGLAYLVRVYPQFFLPLGSVL